MGGVCEFRFSRFKLWKATLTNRFYGKLLVTHLNLRRWKTFLSKISKFVNLSNTTKWFWPWSVNSNDFKRNNTSRDQIDRAVNPDFRLIRSRINRCKYIDLDRRVYLHYRRWHYRRDSTDLGQCRRWTLLTVTLPMGTLLTVDITDGDITACGQDITARAITAAGKKEVWKCPMPVDTTAGGHHHQFLIPGPISPFLLLLDPLELKKA